MKNKYPVLKCNEELWEEIKLVLKSFGINNFYNETFDNRFANYIISNFFSINDDKLAIGILSYADINIAKKGNRYLVNTKEEFLSAVAKLLGKEYTIKSDFKNFKYNKESDEEINTSQKTIISKNNNDLNKDKKDMENINIIEKLKNCPRGFKLYSPIFGEVKLENINDYKINIIAQTSEGDICKAYFEKDGKYYMSYKDAECLLFPSKEQRDWSKFNYLKEGHRVMVSNGKFWTLQEYVSNNIVKDLFSKNLTYTYKYIVPVEDFDFNAKDLNINCIKSIV